MASTACIVFSFLFFFSFFLKILILITLNKMSNTSGGWKKKVLYVTYFLDWTPFCPPPPYPPPPVPPPKQKGYQSAPLNSAFICILRLVKFKAREMLRAKKGNQDA